MIYKLIGVVVARKTRFSSHCFVQLMGRDGQRFTFRPLPARPHFFARKICGCGRQNRIAGGRLRFKMCGRKNLREFAVKPRGLRLAARQGCGCGSTANSRKICGPRGKAVFAVFSRPHFLRAAKFFARIFARSG